MGFDLGSRIKYLRTTRGISQRHVQKQLNKYGSWLSQVESGSVQLYAKDLQLLADVLGVEVGDFFVEKCAGE